MYNNMWLKICPNSMAYRSVHHFRVVLIVHIQVVHGSKCFDPSADQDQAWAAPSSSTVLLRALSQSERTTRIVVFGVLLSRLRPRGLLRN